MVTVAIRFAELRFRPPLFARRDTIQDWQQNPGTARASGTEGGPGPQEKVWATTAPPVGPSAPPTSSEAEPAREQRQEEGVVVLEEAEERSEPSPGVLRDRVPGSSGGAAHGRTSEHPPANAGDSFPHLKPENSGPHKILLISGKIN